MSPALPIDGHRQARTEPEGEAPNLLGTAILTPLAENISRLAQTQVSLVVAA